MAILHKNIQNPNDIHNPKWLPSANNGDYAFKNEKGQLESIDELLLPGALNFVDGSVAPPTTSTGDIYILSSGASVNAGWGSVALQDWVRYDGTAWNSLTPQKSSLCYDKTADSLKFFNGTAWAAIGGGGGGGGNTIYTADDSLTADRIVDCDNNKLSFDVGTLASGTNQNIGVIIDGSNIFYGGGGTSSPLLNVEGQLGNVLNVNTGGFLISKSDFSNAIASFSNRLGTRGLSLNQGTNVMASEQFEIKQQFSQSTGGIIFNGLSNNTQMYFREGSAIQHWIRTGSAQRVHFFSQGMSASFIIGSGALIGSEKISLQAHTAIKGENTLSTSSALQIYDGDGTPNLLVNFKNNGTVNMSSLPTSASGLSSGDIYNDSGTLKIV